MAIIPSNKLQEFNPDEEILEQIQKLEAYDFSEMTNNFIDKGCRFSPEQIYPILAHFGRADP